MYLCSADQSPLPTQISEVRSVGWAVISSIVYMQRLSYDEENVQENLATCTHYTTMKYIFQNILKRSKSVMMKKGSWSIFMLQKLVPSKRLTVRLALQYLVIFFCLSFPCTENTNSDLYSVFVSHFPNWLFETV